MAQRTQSKVLISVLCGMGGGGGGGGGGLLQRQLAIGFTGPSVW